MRTPEQIAADSAAEAAEIANRPARSFRADVEEFFQHCHDRLTKLESGGAIVDEDGNSLAGKIRTFEQRILQVETVQAENTSNLVRLSDLVQTQLGGINQRLANIETGKHDAGGPDTKNKNK